jgi:signal transduction histidine kinase
MLTGPLIRSNRTLAWGPALLAAVLCRGATAFAAEPAGTAPPAVITNLLQLRQVSLNNSGNACPLDLAGQVCWVDSNSNRFALIDATGGAVLELKRLDQPVNVGQRLRLSGAGTVNKAGEVLRVGVDGLEVDDDGRHPATERAGTMLLKPGRIPLRLEWFNGLGPFTLTVDFEGPGLPRRTIEAADLFRNCDPTNRMPGLEYQYYEGWWRDLPDFDRLPPVKTGTVTNFDLSPRTHDQGVGFQFRGFLEVPREGWYTFHLNSDDGSRLSLGEPDVRVADLGQGELPAPRLLHIGQILEECQDGSWSRLEGKVTALATEPDGWCLQLSVGQARLQVNVANATREPGPELMNSRVRVTGFCQGASNPDGLKVPDLLRVPDPRWVEIVARSTAAGTTSADPSASPVLTAAVDVHELKREEAQLKRLAIVRGVVTSIDPGPPGFTLQDATGGLYVQGADPVRLGDFVQVEGVTDPGYFAPMLLPDRILRLGDGRLPEPIRPAWDQLMNGSLDAQYVEIEGIVTTLTADGVRLLTHGGTLTLWLYNGLNSIDMQAYENKLVRLRGVLLANWNAQTHQVKLGEIRLFDPTVQLENSTPIDLLSVPNKTPAELLQFDPQASLFQRIRMSGQIIHISEGPCFMMAGTRGVRFLANKTEALIVGDLVDVAGYPELGGASPLLREAVTRKRGHAPLPAARRLPPGGLISPECDSTRVRVEGILTGLREAGADTLLEMQDGAQRFLAHFVGQHRRLASLPIGGRLELTGVYAVQGDNQVPNRRLASFELLLNSPADVRILARPPWWTLRRLLVMVGTLGCILVVAVLWITQLHRQVDERTTQLEEQIQKRQSIEQHRAMEQERARVARDLHDELGSGLTEIGMLATLPAASPDSSRHFAEIGERSRHMVAALDEIVWAMNPKHDSLESLGSYLCLYADRFLKLANITCRLKGTLDLPGRSLNPIHRHEFFLAFKEALTNVVRHSGATEVRLNIRVIANRLRLSLADNGGGLGSDGLQPGTDGLANMRTRLEKIGGRFTVTSQTGRGTTVRFYLPLD